MTNLQALAIILVSLFSMPGCAVAQTSFSLVKDNGHYFTEATVNENENTRIFIETGSDGMLLNEATYDRILSSLNLEELDIDENASFDFDSNSHKIIRLLKGRISVGGLSYYGKIFVVDSYSDNVLIPFNLLKNETDPTASLIRFDFKKNRLDYIRRDDVDLKKVRTYTIVSSDPMPVFESTLRLSDADGHNAKISGKFVFDLGNASSVFLFHKTMLPLLIEKQFKILPSCDQSGNIIGYGIYARFCRIGDLTNAGISIGITNRFWREDWLGCVGPSFFSKGTVILDPDENLIYY